MDRRSFLKTAGLAAMAGNCAAARSLVLLNVRETTTISGVEWFIYETGLRGPTSEPDRRCALRVTARPGIHGWADVPSWMMPDVRTAATIKDRLLGRDLGWPNAIWRELYEAALPLGTLGAVDVALWDLLGRVQNKPVHALLGTQRQKAKAYVTTPFNLGDLSRYAKYALACKEAGVHGCKIHPYIERGIRSAGSSDTGFADRDMAVYEAVREAVGSDFACMADNGGTYNFDEALRVGLLLDSLQYEWYESPMQEVDSWRDQYIALAGQVKTPVCGPEAHPNSYLARSAWLAAGACDIGRIDVHVGGLTPCIELALACESRGVRLELRDVGLDAHPHLQLIGATSESLIKYVEVSSLSREAHIHPGRTTPEPIFDEHGYIAIPQSLGMGLELDWHYIYTHRVS